MTIRRWGLLLGGAFLALALLEGGGVFSTLDPALTRALQPSTRGTVPLDYFFAFLTLVGNIEATTLAAVLLALGWGRKRGWRGALWVLAPFFGSVVLEALLKLTVPSPSPGPEWSRMPFSFQVLRARFPNGFPSGHMMRMVYLTALLVLAGGGGSPLAVGGASLYLVVFGIGRVWTGQHWASETAGGLLLGAAAAALPLSRLRPAPGEGEAD